MTSVTENDRIDVNQKQTIYNVEITDGYTLETQFEVIVGVEMTQEESTVSAGTYGGYTTSGSQITFKVDSTKTWSVTVSGRK